MELDIVIEKLIKIESKQDHLTEKFGHLEAMYESEERQRLALGKNINSNNERVALLEYKLKLIIWFLLSMIPMALAGLYTTMKFINEIINKT